jgi:hypothetical protein
VLYLRGFDYQAAVGVGGGLAMGFSTVDSTRFNHRLGALLGHDCEVYKALSPLDLERETLALERHFYGDYPALTRLCSAPIRSFFLHADHWQRDVAQLAGRMDYFVVYLSSLSESVLWELQYLHDHGHAGRASVIFDRDAILTKTSTPASTRRCPGWPSARPCGCPTASPCRRRTSTPSGPSWKHTSR